MEATKSLKPLAADKREALLRTLKGRFEQNMHRHPGLTWAKVQARLGSNPEKLRALQEMEASGGEPDVIGRGNSDACVFFDCSPESPEGRSSLCYDGEALESRKKLKPRSSAMQMAAAMGVEILTEEQYRELQQFGEFDTKSSSWLKTPAEIRTLGGAIFGDRRFGRVFVYHNGAESYYSGRGFRACLKV